MDLLGYAALGGLERLTIVAGAVIIGYWGYRLYTAEKNAGLIFMGLAVLVLVGALATGGSYLKSVGEGYQLASLPADAPAQDSSFADTSPTDHGSAPADVTVPTRPDTTAPATEIAADQAWPEPDTAATQAAPETMAPATVAAPAAAPAAEAALADAEVSAADAYVSPARLATGAELGGRIVSVKSENVSLEWSDESGSESE